MAQSLTWKARGLYLGPSDIGETPDGAMTQADNVVISRDGIGETRRGQENVATKGVIRSFPYKDALVGHTGSALTRSSDSGATWTDYAGAYSAPAEAPMRAEESVQNLYFTASDGVKRIDALTSTPEAAGVPAGLDLELALSASTGTAMPTASQVGYRVAFGKKDANGRLLLGAPSGRAVIANSSGASKDVTIVGSLPRGLDASHFFRIYRSQSSATATTDPGDELGLVLDGAIPQERTATSLARATNVVTATTSVDHGYSTGMIVRVGPGGNVAGGGTFAAIGQSVGATSPDGVTWTSRTVPAATFHSVVWSGSQFVAVGASVAATSPDGVTWTSRTIPAGTYLKVAWTGSLFVAVGNFVYATSPDGVTWTARTMTSGSYSGLAWNGSLLVAVGTRITTSPDGITWTERSNPLADNLDSVVWTGSQFTAVGTKGVVGSANGVTWATLTTYTLRDVDDIVWTGTRYVVVGAAPGTTFPGCYHSVDGVTWTAITGLSGTWYYAAYWDGSQVVAVGASVAATSPDGITWTNRTIPAGTYRALSLAGAATFAPGEKAVTGVPTSTTFTYVEAGNDGTLTSTQTVTPLTFAATDTVPDGFLGASLYTNPNQEGILNSNARPPPARDLALFRETMFYAHVTTPASATLYLLGVSGSNGLVADDTITINGLTYTAKTAESVSAREFKLYTSGTVSQNIADTAASLIRVVNRSLSSGVTIVDVSDPNGVPGQMQITASDYSSSLTVTVSRSTAWSPAAGISVAPRTYKNGIVWAKTSQPDHVPLSLALVPKLVGSEDKAILRVLPTRSSLFILKEDGVWRLTGDAGVWDVQPFDPTVRVVAPESAGVLDNTIFALAEQGVVRIADTGVALMSRQPGVCDIEPALQAVIAPALRATTRAYAFGVAYESDHKYLLWLPSSSSDEQSTQAYVYDVFTRTWTRRTDAARHGLVNPADDQLYTVSSSGVTRERKAYTLDDLADGSLAKTINLIPAGISNVVFVTDPAGIAPGDVMVRGPASSVVVAVTDDQVTLADRTGFTTGAATVYKAIPTAMTWAPKFGGSPMRLTQLQEVSLHFDSVCFHTASLSFASNLSQAPQAMTLNGTDYGWTYGVAQAQQQIRAWPPADKAWGNQFTISYSHAQARCPTAVSALGLEFVSTGGKGTR